MRDGEYFHPTTFFFGRETESLIGREIKNISDKVLLHYGQGSIKRIGLYDAIKDSLDDHNIEIIELGGVHSNPKDDLIYEGIGLCKKYDIQFVLAVGGGSVIDSAKAICVGAHYDDDFVDFYSGKAVPKSALGLGVVLTIPGSGSESTTGSVISCLKTQEKKVCDSTLMLPAFVIMNPDYTKTVSYFDTMCGIVDATSHIFERYFTNVAHVDSTDRICEGLLATLIKYSTIIADDHDNLDNYDVRSEIMWACKLAQDQTPGFGRHPDGGCHKIGHAIGSVYDDIPHGAIMGVIFLAWMKTTISYNDSKLAQLGERVFCVSGDTNYELASKAINEFSGFLKSINMPTSLQDIGICDDQYFSIIANKAITGMQSKTVGNFVRLDVNNIHKLLHIAF